MRIENVRTELGRSGSKIRGETNLVVLDYYSKLNVNNAKIQATLNLCNATKELENIKGTTRTKTSEILNTKENILNALSQSFVEKSGYAAALLFGGAVVQKHDIFASSVEDLEIGDTIKSYFRDGSAESKVTDIYKGVVKTHGQ